MRAVRIALTLLGAGMAGALLGATAGYLLGMRMAHGYRPYGPSDPGDVPVYVVLGLTMFLSLIGGAVGIVAAAVRLWHRSKQVSTPGAA